MAKLQTPDRQTLAALLDAESVLHVRVTPNARHDAITVEEGRLRVRVTVVPEDGKANKAVVTLLAKAFGLPKSAFEIIRGDTARDKQIRIRR